MSSRGDADVFMEVRPVASWNAIEFTFGVGATNREKKRAQQLRWGPHLHIFFLSTRPTRRKRPHLHIMDVVIRVNRGVPLIDDGPIRGFQ